MKKFKKIMAVLLAYALVFNLSGITVFADSLQTIDRDANDEKKTVICDYIEPDSENKDETVIDEDCNAKIDYTMAAEFTEEIYEKDDFKQTVSGEFVDKITGTYRGTYYGSTDGNQVARETTLVITDCSTDGRINGFVEVTKGDYFFAYYVQGAASEKTGLIVLEQTEWIFRPSDDCATEQFMGNYDVENENITGDSFSFAKASEKIAICSKDAIPQYWKGEYTGQYSYEGDCGNNVSEHIRRNYYFTINKINDDGTFEGTGHVYPHYNDGRDGELTIGYDLDGKIDFTTGYIEFQGFRFTEVEEGYDTDNFLMVQFKAIMIAGQILGYGSDDVSFDMELETTSADEMFSITYILDGTNSPNNPDYYSVGAKFELAYPLEESDREFAGWFIKNDAGELENIRIISSDMKGDLTLYGVWCDDIAYMTNPSGVIDMNGGGDAYANFRIVNPSNYTGDMVFTVTNDKNDTKTVTTMEPWQYANRDLLIYLGNTVDLGVPFKDKTESYDPDDVDITFFVNIKYTENGEEKEKDVECPVSITPYSYYHEWSGKIGYGAEVGAGFGAGAKVGPVELDADVASVGASMNRGTTFTVRDTYSSGSRQLKLSSTYADEVDVNGSLGPQGNVQFGNGQIKGNLINLSGKGSVNLENQKSIIIDNYDPKNVSQAKRVGYFVLDGMYTSSQNVMLGQIASFLPDLLEYDEYATNLESSYGGGVSLDSFGYGKADDPTDYNKVVSLLDVQGSRKYTDKNMYTDRSNGYKRIFDRISNLGMGIFNFTVPVVGTQTSAIGGDASISDISMWLDRESQHIEYTLGTQSSEGVFLKTQGHSVFTSIYLELKDYQAMDNATFNHFVDDRHPIHYYRAPQLLSAKEAIDNYKPVLAYEDYEDEVTSWAINMGVSLQLAIKLGINADFVYNDEVYYEKSSGFVKEGKEYIMASDVALDVEQTCEEESVFDYFTDSLETIAADIDEKITTACEWVDGKIQNGKAWVEDKADAVEDFVVSISSVVDTIDLHTYYAVGVDADTVSDEGVDVDDSQDSGGCVVTMGKAYLVNVYTDESMTETISNVTDSSLNVTLEYTDEMLDDLKVTPEEELNIKLLFYNSANDSYEIVDNSVLDVENNTVTAPLTKSGQYILAIDKIAPVISDFRASDRMAKPEITATISDFSTITGFSFKVDGNEVVNMDNLSAYYNAETDLFKYVPTTELSEGKHTFSIEAEDCFGNKMSEPLVLELEIDTTAPVVSLVEARGAIIEGKDAELTLKTNDKDVSAAAVEIIGVDENGKKSQLVAYEFVNDSGEYVARINCPETSVKLLAKAYLYDAAGNKSEDYAIEFDVERRVDATGILATDKELTLKLGESKKLAFTFAPENANSNLELNCKSVDSSIVKVDSSGVVTALSGGKTKIKVALSGDASKFVEYTINVEADLSNSLVTGLLPTYEYTGEEIKPEISVYYGDNRLKENINYEVKYSNNIDEGVATVEVTGIGNYTGKVTKTFEIAKKSGGDNPGGDNPGGDNPGGDNPGGDTSGGDNPGGDTSGGDNPGGDTSGGDNPGGDTPGNDKVVLGDADMSGKVDLKDAKIVLKAALGIESLTKEQNLRSDVNKDTKVDLNDAKLVLKFSLGIITKF